MDRKGLGDEKRGRESKGQERTGELLGGNQQRKRSGTAGHVEEGEERQTQGKGGEVTGKKQRHLYL